MSFNDVTVAELNERVIFVYRIGQLAPTSGRPVFCQMYIYDVHNEMENRLAVMPGLDATDRQLLEQLQAMLETCNPFIRIFKQAAQQLLQTPAADLMVL